jgi:hypothetical protein
MVGFTDVTAQANLDGLITGYPYLGLFTAVGTDAGSGFTESSFTGYARVNTTGLWAAASGSAPSSKQNNATINFALGTTAGSNIIAVGLFSALTAGALGWWNYLGSYPWQPATFSAASPSVITVPGHGFANGDSVVMTGEIGSEGATPPGFLTGLLTVAGATADTFNVGVNAGNTGGVMLRKVVPQTVIANMTVQFTANQLVLSLA